MSTNAAIPTLSGLTTSVAAGAAGEGAASCGAQPVITGKANNAKLITTTKTKLLLLFIF
jgi:hypothetical protein